MSGKPLITIDFNSSGVDAGEIGYSINVERVEDLSDPDFSELLDVIESLKESSTLSGRHLN